MKIIARSGLDLHRAAHLRDDGDRLAVRLAHPETVFLPLWRNRVCLSKGDDPSPVVLSGSLPERGETEPVWLGLIGSADCFAWSLDPGRVIPDDLAAQCEFHDLRLVGSMLRRSDAEVLAYARGMLSWHRHHRFCAHCGELTSAVKGGHVRLCTGCGREHFPRTDPAIMALVIRGDQCLLARQPSFPPGMFSVLAGFVEIGESLEDAVRREVSEEVGLEVADVRYIRSQPWPFPASLMLGFSCRAQAGELRVDGQEIEEARWLSREEIRSPRGFFIPPPFSLAHHLIAMFRDG